MTDKIGASAPTNLTEAHSMIKEAMKDVKQELVIIHGDKQHLVYIHDVVYNNGLQVDYSTLSDSDEIAALVQEAMEAQFKQYNEKKKWSKQSSKTLSSIVRTLLRFGRT